jgi:hypothetical protein
MHLSSAFLELGASSRTQLPTVLAASEAAVTVGA